MAKKQNNDTVSEVSEKVSENAMKALKSLALTLALAAIEEEEIPQAKLAKWGAAMVSPEEKEAWAKASAEVVQHNEKIKAKKAAELDATVLAEKTKEDVKVEENNLMDISECRTPLQAFGKMFGWDGK